MAVQTTYNDAPAVAYAGMLVGHNYECISMYNSEASAEIAFGWGVKFGSTSGTDQDALLPAAETDKVAGILVKSDVYDRTYSLAGGGTAGELGTTGLKPGAMMNILRKGTIWAVCEDGCVPGDRLWVRCTAGGAGEVVGGLNSADEGTETIDCTAQGVWMSTASAGGLAMLEVDFTNI